MARRPRAGHAPRHSAGPGMRPTPWAGTRKLQGTWKGPHLHEGKGRAHSGPWWPEQAAHAWAGVEGLTPCCWLGQCCSDTQEDRRAGPWRRLDQREEGAGEGALQTQVTQRSCEGRAFKLGYRRRLAHHEAEQAAHGAKCRRTFTPAPRRGRMRGATQSIGCADRPAAPPSPCRHGKARSAACCPPTHSRQATADRAGQRRAGSGVTRRKHPASSVRSETRRHSPACVLACCVSLLCQLPGGSVAGNPPQCRGRGSKPRVRKVPWSRRRRKWPPTPALLPEITDRGGLGGTVQGVKEFGHD